MVKLAKVSKPLGHKNQQTTLNYYNSITVVKADEKTQPSTAMDLLVDKLPEGMTDYDYIDWDDAQGKRFDQAKKVLKKYYTKVHLEGN